MEITISNSKLSATINYIGAELTSLKANLTNREYIWEGNNVYWGKHAPLLFPIVGTLKNNTYSYKNVTYNLNRHGFARDQQFELISHKRNEAVFSLKSNEHTFKIYPFLFELEVVYILIKSELYVTYKVKNLDSGSLPFSIGGHPAFALNKKIEAYALRFEFQEELISYQLENDLLSDKTNVINLKEGTLPLTYSLFKNDALIFKEIKSKQIQILENKIPILNFKYANFPSLGLWTKQDAPFICLEPWAGYSDTFYTNGNILEKEGIQILSGNSVTAFKFSIEIQYLK